MNRYYSVNDYLKNKYGEKIYKLALDAGFTCPNRDGTCGTGGCIFCTEGGSGDFAKSNLKEAKQFIRNIPTHVISSPQILNSNSLSSAPAHTISTPQKFNLNSIFSDSTITDKAENSSWQRQSKNTGNKFIAYYQSYSNTYAPVDKLREIYQSAIDDEEIVGLSIATRPDCINEEIINLISEINGIKPVWIELGLQTIHERTAKWFNRGYSLDVFDHAVRLLRSKGIDVIVHLILGLPGESHEDMLESVRYMNSCDIQGVKLHLLTIMKNTRLGNLFLKSIQTLNIGNETNCCTDNESDKNEVITHINIENEARYRFCSSVADILSKNFSIKSSLTNASIVTSNFNSSLADTSHIITSDTDGFDFLLPDSPPYHCPSLEEYANLVCDCIGNLRPDIVIHRFTGDAPKELLLTPLWTAQKKRVLNTIHHELSVRNITQGCLLA